MESFITNIYIDGGILKLMFAEFLRGISWGIGFGISMIMFFMVLRWK